MKKIKILLLYKKSSYRRYFLNKRSSLFSHRKDLLAHEGARFKKIHIEHYETLKAVERILSEKKVPFHKCVRGRPINYSKYTHIITVGGDGTLLEAARNVSHQLLLGVNSVPKASVGKFCVATSKNFSRILDRILTGKAKIKTIQRLRVKMNGKVIADHVVNDILVCHKNPAAMTRYGISIKGICEEHRNSGLWISTAAGSTGAIYSAGGKRLGLAAKTFQYMPRELYRAKNDRHQLCGGILAPGSVIKLVSFMREGMVFIDGAHEKHPFAFGSKMSIQRSPTPLKIYVSA